MGIYEESSTEPKRVTHLQELDLGIDYQPLHAADGQVEVCIFGRIWQFSGQVEAEPNARICNLDRIIIQLQDGEAKSCAGRSIVVKVKAKRSVVVFVQKLLFSSHALVKIDWCLAVRVHWNVR